MRGLIGPAIWQNDRPVEIEWLTGPVAGQRSSMHELPAMIYVAQGLARRVEPTTDPNPAPPSPASP